MNIEEFAYPRPHIIIKDVFSEKQVNDFGKVQKILQKYTRPTI